MTTSSAFSMPSTHNYNSQKSERNITVCVYHALFEFRIIATAFRERKKTVCFRGVDRRNSSTWAGGLGSRFGKNGPSPVQSRASKARALLFIHGETIRLESGPHAQRRRRCAIGSWQSFVCLQAQATRYVLAGLLCAQSTSLSMCMKIFLFRRRSIRRLFFPLRFLTLLPQNR
jgi:hypothetical protein